MRKVTIIFHKNDVFCKRNNSNYLKNRHKAFIHQLFTIIYDYKTIFQYVTLSHCFVTQCVSSFIAFYIKSMLMLFKEIVRYAYDGHFLGIVIREQRRNVCMGIHHFFTSLNDLERIIRCPGRFKFEEHNVAAHSWKVSQYAMFFATLEEMNGATVDWKSLYEKTINHDFAEVFIGDIKTPVKHASPELKQMLAHVEEKMMEKFIIDEIPEQFQDIFFARMKEGKDGSLEGLLLEFADKLDQFYESFAELKRGNSDKEFVVIYRNALSKILQLPLPNSIAYFREIILQDAINEETHIDLQTLTHEILNENR